MFDETPVLSSLLDMQACTILVHITLLPVSKAVLFGSKGKGIYLVLVKLGAIHMSRCVGATKVFRSRCLGRFSLPFSELSRVGQGTGTHQSDVANIRESVEHKN